jgi:hypothetical protein
MPTKMPARDWRFHLFSDYRKRSKRAKLEWKLVHGFWMSARPHWWRCQRKIAAQKSPTKFHIQHFVIRDGRMLNPSSTPAQTWPQTTFGVTMPPVGFNHVSSLALLATRNRSDPTRTTPFI